MQGFWITFTDGTKGYCEGSTPYHAVQIASKLTGKIVIIGSNKYKPEIPTLPYPANPVIWQFDCPVNGKCPTFCHSPNECKGRTSCPQNPSCTE